jgi:hypothetical protein
MGANVATNAALKDASKRHAERQEYAFRAARRLYESGRPLRRGCREIHVDEGTVRKWATEHGWVRGVLE